MHSRPFKLVIIAAPLILGTIACGSSDGSSTTPPPVVENNDPANTATPDEAAPSVNEEVEAYCTAVDEFVEANEQLLADPTSVDVEAITQQGLDLATATAALATSATGDDAARVQECSAKFSDIGA